MEVAPQELAQLLKLAGVGTGPEPEIMSEPDMLEPDIGSDISVMAIPSDDGAPVGGGCGAPEHDHDPGGEMRGIIDMLKGGGEEPIEVEESPPKDDYENASNEFTGHPVGVVDTYDQYSYEPAKNSGMQRRTNSYGDNPLREDDLIKEYTEFKKKPLTEKPNKNIKYTVNNNGEITTYTGAQAEKMYAQDQQEPGDLSHKFFNDGNDGFGTGFDTKQKTQKTNYEGPKLATVQTKPAAPAQSAVAAPATVQTKPAAPAQSAVAAPATVQTKP